MDFNDFMTVITTTGVSTGILYMLVKELVPIIKDLSEQIQKNTIAITRLLAKLGVDENEEE